MCGEEFKKVLSFSAFSSYQLLLFRTLCVCVSVVKITQTKKMQVVVVVFSLAGGPKFRADGLLSQTIKKHLPLLWIFSQVKQNSNNNKKRFISFGPVRPPFWRQTHKPQVARAPLHFSVSLIFFGGFIFSFWAGASIFSTYSGQKDKDCVKGIPPSLIFPILFSVQVPIFFFSWPSLWKWFSKLDIKLDYYSRAINIFPALSHRPTCLDANKKEIHDDGWNKKTKTRGDDPCGSDRLRYGATSNCQRRGGSNG